MLIQIHNIPGITVHQKHQIQQPYILYKQQSYWVDTKNTRQLYTAWVL